ncbi:MAG: tetratricopeptide repeat protein [Xenococcaceae cyanobacterium MO_167.B27]|nr:tetratricopeptide repeat protein [Xenococcaceae cyanobacterium MO_167.B27]
MKYKNYLVLTILTFLSVVSVSPAIAQPTLVSNSSLQQHNLLQQGKQLYDRGQFAAAAKIWEQAQQKYTQNQQITNLIHSNNYLATVYQDLGDWNKAQAAIAENLDLIEKLQHQVTRRNTNNSPLLQAQTLNTQGSLQLKQGNGESAFNTWQQTEAIYRPFPIPQSPFPIPYSL